MSTFVLVPGFWLGAWAWDGVTEPLRAAGHAVHPVTLTGLAERAAEGGPQVDLETHITDVTGLLAEADLREVVLVAHSGGTGAVTGAADRAPERIRRVVYLDSGPLPGGATLAELNPGLAKREVGDGRLPLPSFEELAESGASLAGLGPAERALMRERATDHPAGVLHQPLRLSGAGDALPKTLVSCSFPLDQVRALIAAGHPWFAALSGPEWELTELPTGHWPMFSRPEETARVLAEVADR
ncbi:alpha/beta fold hydrolase [Streptacidiphilus jiangxiensis]|uniref:Pimeloyl-ACP methyl ester carboxylesterase n=1 Tax=Streptacidiphilus jiangxiensis TaxID=235985 RepID=A0A1H7FGH9_STRJI|nr:alpha/beta hydrolase [Streptacidiphilus jiangxiensis]SEK25079.1 Pimeloyl-ACP methyl ester carboxylesterase [Streptacidiphilus jiangxiensis]